MEYREYIGSVSWSEEDNCFHGKILFISDLVSYRGNSLKELKQDFEEAVDEYIELLKYLNTI